MSDKVSGSSSDRRSGASRRSVVGGLVGLGVGGPVLAACGSASGSGGGSPSATTGGALGPTSDVPVGSGKIYPAQKVVVTQPTAGQFKAFSAICTHQGCVLAKVEGNDIECTCHGSKFSIKDGSVLAGPAKQPLDQLQVSTDGGKITVTG